MADYITENIRRLLLRGFDSRELEDHCFDNKYFSDALPEVSPSPSSAELARTLLSFAKRKGLIDELLTMAQRLNPAAFEQYGPYTRITPNMQGETAPHHGTAIRPTDRNKAHALRLQAAAMVGDGKWAEVIRLLERAVETDPTNQEAAEDLRQARKERTAAEERRRREEQQQADREAARVEKCHQLWASLDKARARGAWATVKEIQRSLDILGCR